MQTTQPTYSENFWRSYDARPTWAAEATPAEWFSYYIVSGKQTRRSGV